MFCSLICHKLSVPEADYLMTCVLLNKAREEDAQGIPCLVFFLQGQVWRWPGNTNKLVLMQSNSYMLPFDPAGQQTYLCALVLFHDIPENIGSDSQGCQGDQQSLHSVTCPGTPKADSPPQLISPWLKHSLFISLGGDVLVLQGCLQSQRALQRTWRAHYCSTSVFNGRKLSQISLLAMEKVQCMWKVPAAPLGGL